MASLQKIKLSIADRVYPLTVTPNQEEALRKAAKSIEETIKKFEENYAVRDKQDVLAMCALQFAAQAEQQEINQENDQNLVLERLKKFNRLLENIDL